MPELGLEMEEQVSAGKAEELGPWEELRATFWRPKEEQAPAKKRKKKKLQRRSAFALFRSLDWLLQLPWISHVKCNRARPSLCFALCFSAASCAA